MSEKLKDQVRDFNDTLSAFDVARAALVTDPELLDLLRKSAELVRNMDPDVRDAMLRQQALSYAVAEATPCEHGSDWDDCQQCWDAWRERCKPTQALKDAYAAYRANVEQGEADELSRLRAEVEAAREEGRLEGLEEAEAAVAEKALPPFIDILNASAATNYRAGIETAIAAIRALKEKQP